jgi:hypothetical protein
VKHPLLVTLAFIVGTLAGAGTLKILTPTVVGAQPSQLPSPTPFKVASGFSWGIYMVLIGDDGTSRICLANTHNGQPFINKCEPIVY